ncbi:methyl-accepting chemotaxis protein [uncultured Shewanella sp.]|uniref:methyl-accepting chemotaxis protein n=1 Tax=uncultured Shewanella sp. TaxID=173975 RepID=UPI002618BF15|nr:methyl-accepting chemotaxis protein [uncultured Shewanella sp.]
MFKGMTIKIKLIILASLVTTSMLLYGVFENVIINKIIYAEEVASQNWFIESELLALRRHEKDFFSRMDDKYLEKHAAVMVQIKKDLVKLNEDHLLLFNIGANSSTTLNQLDNYQRSFVELAQLSHQIYDKDGLEKEIDATRAKLEEAIVNTNSIRVEHLMVELIESDYEFRINHSQQTLEELLISKQALELAIEEYPGVRPVYDAYFGTYNELIELHLKIGFEYNEGLRGVMRVNAQEAEAGIVDNAKSISLLISDYIEGQKVRLHILGLVLLLFTLSFVYLIATNINSRLNALNHMVKKLSTGNRDLTSRINFEGRDEFSDIARSFNRFVESLQEAFQEIRDSYEAINLASHDMSDKLNMTTQGFSDAVVRVNSISSSVHELVSVNSEINLSINATDDASNQLGKANEQALDISKQSNAEINDLNERLLSGQEKISELNEQSVKIQSVTKAIQELASQINLLSLNAAIEAARAGEQGRGFAVVADEVRGLSGKTDEATLAIDETIVELQKKSSSS